MIEVLNLPSLGIGQTTFGVAPVLSTKSHGNWSGNDQLAERSTKGASQWLREVESEDLHIRTSRNLPGKIAIRLCIESGRARSPLRWAGATTIPCTGAGLAAAIEWTMNLPRTATSGAELYEVVSHCLASI